MAVMQMQRVSICALKRDRKAILEKLQTMGVMEMTQVLDDESGFEKMDTQGARTTFEKESESGRSSTGYPAGIRTGKEIPAVQSGRKKTD